MKNQSFRAGGNITILLTNEADEVCLVCFGVLIYLLVQLDKLYHLTGASLMCYCA